MLHEKSFSIKIQDPDVETMHSSYLLRYISLQLIDDLYGCLRSGRKLAIVIMALTLLSSNQYVIAQSSLDHLHAQMEPMDVVAIARIVKGMPTDMGVEFELLKILRGQDLLHKNQKVRVNYIDYSLEGTHFLLMGAGQPKLLWSDPLPISLEPVSEKVIAYLDAVLQLPTDPSKRLEFYLEYLQHEEKLLARDAFAELATASYEQWVKLKPKLNREKLVAWVSDADISFFRKDLYFVLLGICGIAEDHKLIETMMRSGDPKKHNCLTAMIICYVSIRGDDGLNLIDDLITGNENCDFLSLYCLCHALRFLGGSKGIVREERVVESLRLILRHPMSIEMRDKVIYQLAARADWSQLDHLIELFKSADKDHQHVRVPIFNYLRVCPEPEAVKLIDELKKIDPKAHNRSLKFFWGLDPQKRVVEYSNSWDLRYIFVPTSMQDLYD